MKRKNLYVVLLCIFIFIFSNTLLVLDRKYTILENLFKNVNKYICSYIDDRLYKEVKSDNIINSRIKYLEKENDELKKSVKIKEEHPNTITSKVINHVSNSFYDRVEINKGLDYKINVGDAVINSSGLVGFISKTGKKVSEVNLLVNVNNNFKVSVLIENSDSNLYGILSSYDNKTKLFKITNIRAKDKIKIGSKVYLSGYNNSSYKNIYIGKIKDEKVSDYGLTKTLYLKSDVDFNNLFILSVEVS